MEQDSEQRRAALIVALVAIGVPVVAEIAASLTSDSPDRGYGPIFYVGAVLGAMVATWRATRRGLWWLIPAQPLIIVPVAVGGTILAEPGGTKTAKLGTDSATALQHVFLVAVAAIVAIIIVAVVKAVTGRYEAETAARRPVPPQRRDAARAAGARRTGASRG